MTKRKEKEKNYSLAMTINCNEARKLKKRNKEIAEIIRHNKVDESSSTYYKIHKILNRLKTVMSKPTTAKILKNNPKAKLKIVPEMTKNFLVEKTKESRTTKYSNYVINVLKTEFKNNEARKLELKNQRIYLDSKIKSLTNTNSTVKPKTAKPKTTKSKVSV